MVNFLVRREIGTRGQGLQRGEDCGGFERVCVCVCVCVCVYESLGGCMSVLNNCTREKDSSPCRKDRNTFYYSHMCVIASSCSDLGGEREHERKERVKDRDQERKRMCCRRVHK